MITADRTAMRACCASMAFMGAPHLPVFTAVEQGQIALGVFTDPASIWTAGAIKRLPRPTIILISDDPDIGAGTAKGPYSWTLASKLRGWADAVLVHGAGGEPEHYRQALAMAKRHGRLALIDTSSQQAMPWAAFMAHPVSMIIVPTDGPHPVMPPGRVMQ